MFSTAGILQQVQINAQELNLCSGGYGTYTKELIITSIKENPLEHFNYNVSVHCNTSLRSTMSHIIIESPEITQKTICKLRTDVAFEYLSLSWS